MTTKEKFLAALEVIRSIPQDGTFEPSEEVALNFYAYEKQATEGRNYTPKPFVWNVTARKQWNAWYNLGNMLQKTAMEKYIEELTKVIEVMSYNEQISNFMSLMGSFYDIDCVAGSQNEGRNLEENPFMTSTIEECHLPTLADLYNMSKSVTVRNSVQKPEKTQILRVPVRPNVYSSSSSSSSEISNFDLLSDVSDVDSTPPTPREFLNSYKTQGYTKGCPFFTEKDFLALAIINLQTSLEEILKKLDNLIRLTESTSFNSVEDTRENQPCDSWTLNCAGTALALLWPVAVELYFQTRRK